MLTKGYGRTVFGVVASVALALTVAGCGGGGGAGGSGGSAPASSAGGAGAGGGAGAAGPTKLPAGLTAGCVGDASDPTTCVYGGDAKAPTGVPTVNVNQVVTADKLKLVDPMALTKDKSAPGGSYISTPTGNSGDALVAVNIPADGYYQIYAALQSGDTTTSHDSFYFGFGTDEPPQDHDHTWDINPDGAWHKLGDTAGGGVQIRHDGAADAPDHIDAWHLKKGLALIHIMGREDNSNLAQLEVVPAKAGK